MRNRASRKKQKFRLTHYAHYQIMTHAAINWTSPAFPIQLDLSLDLSRFLSLRG